MRSRFPAALRLSFAAAGPGSWQVGRRGTAGATTKPFGSVTAVSAPKADGAVIETVKLNKYYGAVHALRNLDLQVHEGDVFGFLGPNGAGKTTFTKCLLGFIKPTSGWVRLFGDEVTGRDRRALARVGIVPDQFGFYDLLTGRQHLEFYGRLFGIAARDLEQRIEELTKLVRLEHRMDSRVRTYSHGMRQRLVIAHALLNDPDLIIFDEPTTGLDPKGAYEVRLLLKDLARRGVTTFLSSHILHEVEEICNRVGILDRGVLLKVAKVSELRAEFTAGAGERVEILLDNPSVRITDRVAGVVGVQHVEAEAGRLAVTVSSPDRVPDVVSSVVEAGGRVRGVHERTVTLEEMFLHYTDDQEGPGSEKAPKAWKPAGAEGPA